MSEPKDAGKEEQKDITLTITFHPDNRPPQVTGPLANKPLCIYMLEVAKDMVKVWRPEEPKVKPAGIMDFVRKKRF